MCLIVKCDNKGREIASRHVKSGGVIVYPTDTVYGLGADPYNKDAIDKIFLIKERGKHKPLPLLASSLNHVNRIAYISIEAKRLIDKFWPGALTIIMPLRDDRLRENLGIDKAGIRIPNHKCALRLIEECNGILIGTSANISGSSSIKSIEELDDRLRERVDVIIDDGKTLGIESTVIDIIDKKIVREGYIKKYVIEEVLKYEL